MLQQDHIFQYIPIRDVISKICINVCPESDAHSHTMSTKPSSISEPVRKCLLFYSKHEPHNKVAFCYLLTVHTCVVCGCGADGVRARCSLNGLCGVEEGSSDASTITTAW